MTALMKAVNQNDAEAVRKLIAQGVNVDELEPNGDAPLVMAAYQGHSEIVRLLLEAGADVKAVDPGMKATALHAAAYAGRTEAAKLLVAAPHRDRQAGTVQRLYRAARCHLAEQRRGGAGADRRRGEPDAQVAQRRNPARFRQSPSTRPRSSR